MPTILKIWASILGIYTGHLYWAFILGWSEERQSLMSKFFAQFISHLKRFIASAGGATAIEWVMIAALLGIVLVASASPITDSLRPHLDSTADSLVDIRTHE